MSNKIDHLIISKYNNAYIYPEETKDRIKQMIIEAEREYNMLIIGEMGLHYLIGRLETEFNLSRD